MVSKRNLIKGAGGAAAIGGGFIFYINDQDTFNHDSEASSADYIDDDTLVTISPTDDPTHPNGVELLQYHQVKQLSDIKTYKTQTSGINYYIIVEFEKSKISAVEKREFKEGYHMFFFLDKEPVFGTPMSRSLFEAFRNPSDSNLTKFQITADDKQELKQIASKIEDKRKTVTDQPTTPELSGPQLPKVWEIEVDSNIKTELAAVDKNIYAGSTAGTIYSFNSGGDVEWKVQTSSRIEGSLNAGTNVYAGALDGSFYSIAGNGESLWGYNVHDSLVSPPTIADNVVIVVNETGTIFAFSKSGENVWQVTTDSSVLTQPALGQKEAIVCSGDGNIYSVDITSGDIIWKYDADGPFISSPIVNGSKIYAANDTVHSLTLDGEKIWATELDETAINDVSYYRGSIFVANSNKLYSINASTGDTRWQLPTDRSVSTPDFNNEIIYASRPDGILEVDSSKGELVNKYSSNYNISTKPTIFNSLIVVGTLDKRLVAYKLPDD